MYPFHLEKGTGWSKNKAHRFKQQPQNTPLEVGPGKYNPKNEIPNGHDMNSSNGFASKTLRVWDQRKG